MDLETKLLKNVCSGLQSDKKSGLIDAVYYYLSIKRAARKIDWNLYIQKEKEICSGKPCIKGTRISAETIYYYYYLNNSNDNNSLSTTIRKINKEYPSLNEEKILMAIVYHIKTNSLLKLISQK